MTHFNSLFSVFAIVGMLLTTSTGFASDTELVITNKSDHRVDFGYFKGRKMPSLCEDGFCWEEVWVKLRPFNSKTKNIKDTVDVLIPRSVFNKQSLFLVLNNKSDDMKQFEIVLCEDLDRDNQYYYPRISGKVSLSSQLTKSGYCVDEGSSTHITVEEPLELQ